MCIAVRPADEKGGSEWITRGVMGRAAARQDASETTGPPAVASDGVAVPQRRVRVTDDGARSLTEGEIASLVERARGGDTGAFGLLYETYRRRIFNLSRFSLPYAAAEDAVAETFVRAWAALPKYRDMGVPFVAWLYGIARNVVADAQRVACRVEPRAEPRTEDLDRVAPREHEIDRVTLGAALDALPAEHRTVIELKFLAGLTNEEVANVLGKTPGAVNTQQWRALAALREYLETA